MIARWLSGGLAALMLASPAMAQEAQLGGEIRPRFEIRDPVGAPGTTEFTSLRTRASLSVALDGGVTAFIQLQDVRVFGEEAGTLTDYSADGLDLHQGWVQLADADADSWSVRVGRQEAAYGGERLVGAVNWTQQARAFDGARIRLRPSSSVVVDGLAFRISDADVAGTTTIDESLYGVYSTLETDGSVDLFGLLNTHSEAAGDRDVFTLGSRWVASRDNLMWRLEGAYQLGESSSIVGIDRDIRSFMLGARLGTMLTEELGATLWYDYLSGDDDPADNTVRVFDTLFATNHKFYGYMDLFLNIPVDTNQRGLQDLALKGSYDFGEGRTLAADLHTFHLAADEGLDSGHIGEELDLTYQWVYSPGVTMTTGVSYFLSADAWSTALGNADDDELWGYLMLDLTF